MAIVDTRKRCKAPPGPTRSPGLTAVALLLGLGFFAAAPCRAAQPPADATGRGECQAIRSAILAQSVPYCVLLPPSYDTQKTRRYPVLYFLHGLGDDEQTFLHSGGWSMVQDLWQRRQMGEFIIVTPRGGSSFYINSRDGNRRYEDFFLGEFLPAIEKRYRIRSARESRGIAGISMGGYGALRMAFRHPGLFASVSTTSAALIEKLPAITAGDSPLSGPLRLLGDVFGSPLDRAFYDANNPLTLARAADLSRLKIYFDCGTEDDYGFNIGAQKLHDLLLSRQIAHEFHLYPGGHNVVYFADHLAASLQFDSRAFGLTPAAQAGN
jgi:S-formylglutathione hydrolase FrmB